MGIPTRACQLVSLSVPAPIVVDRRCISTPEGTTLTDVVADAKPGADTVTMVVPLTFSTPCTKIGMLPVQLPEADVQELIQSAEGEPGARAEVDLEAQVVRMPGGREVPFEIDPVIRERLLNGWDDIALTLAHEDEIAAYEHDREREGPVTTPFA